MSDSQHLFSSGAASQSEEEIEAAREELRKRLPELRELPGFPQGTDEAILRMSIPPAYTACPNPFITDWLKESEPDGYGEEPYEDPGPYAADVSVGKSHPIYKAHSYPTKVPHEAIMRYILHYTRPGDVVLDGFCGTGMTGVAAQACGNPEPKVKQEIETEMGKVRWGARRAILQDLSPAATFIAAGLNLPIDAEAFDRRSKEILEEFEAQWGWMYETTHADGSKAKIDYTVWSEVFTCPHCGGEVLFYDVAFNEKTGKVKDEFPCSHCGATVTKKSLERRKVPIRTLGSDVIDRIEFRPVKIHYRVGKRKLVKDPDQADLEALERVDASTAIGFPNESIPHMHMTHERNNLPAMGFSRVHHLVTSRALLSLGFLWKKASDETNSNLRTALQFWIEQGFWGLSLMNRYRPDGFSQVSQYQSGVYYVPALHSECSIMYNLAGRKRESLVRVWSNAPGLTCSMMSTASSTSTLVPDQSVDYIFVDPPFGGNIYYADLAYFVESWRRVFESPKEEAILDRNKQRPKGMPDYEDLMARCFREFFRVLLPGRWMTVEFSNSSNEVWLAIQEALSAVGFVVADTRVFDKEHLSYRQVTARNAVKRDLIISAYKPAAELEERFSTVAGSEEGAWEFVREHVVHLPITEGSRGEARVARERQADRLYDRMVAFHVHHGESVPLTAGEFYSGLEQRFPERDGMYFLNEQVESYERHRLTIKELLQAELFITNESSAVQWLRQILKKRSRPFSEIHPVFLAELQAGLPEWEDLPDLKNLLEENFLQDSKGGWYVPDPKKVRDLEQLRTRALLKMFDTYVNHKEKLERFRSEAVRAGFKEAWGRRDFHLILTVGKKLPDDAFTEDEQLLYYYDNARRLAE